MLRSEHDQAMGWGADKGHDRPTLATERLPKGEGESAGQQQVIVQHRPWKKRHVLVQYGLDEAVCQFCRCVLSRGTISCVFGGGLQATKIRSDCKLMCLPKKWIWRTMIHRSRYTQ